MACEAKEFWLPRKGNTLAEYEDAAASDPARGRFAIADGATQSSFAAPWSKLLVERFVAEPACNPSQWTAWLPPVQSLWVTEIGERDLPWYAERKFQKGAFAAFLGLVVEAGGAGADANWRAIAVGDCCAFHVRDGEVRQAFPLTHSSAFDNRPNLIGSRDAPALLFHKNRISTCTGTWRTGDSLWLMTDALSKWFLARAEAGERPVEIIEDVLRSGNDAFANLIDHLRAAKTLHNDDVTLLAVRP